MKADLAVLASDDMAGREAGQPGFDAAAGYVARRMLEMGLSPGVKTKGDRAAWRQPVPLLSVTRRAATSTLTITGPDGVRPLTYGADFLPAQAPRQDGAVATAEGEAVFVGHGVVDSKGRWDDYGEIDVTGKIVVMFDGAPTDLPDGGFHTEERTYLTDRTTKEREARKRGAAGALFLRTPRTQVWSPWRRVVARAGRADMVWQGPEGAPNNPGGLAAAATLSRAGAETLFTNAPFGFDDLIQALEEKEPLPSAFSLGRTVALTAASNAVPINSSNVVGMLEGADPALRQEAVVLTAHLDHVGARCSARHVRTLKNAIENNTPEDCIHNGAMDNALGVASMLEVARALTAGPPPARTIYFVALTAEEKGLIGADYFTTFPPIADHKIVANINLDMPLVLFPFTDVIAIGADRSTLKPIVESAAASMGLTVSPDPVPSQGLFTRSDHFRFVQKGVPSVFLFIGFENGGEKVFRDFIATHYHQPSDDVTRPIHWPAAARFARLSQTIAYAIAMSPEAPRWNKGDFFGALFANARSPGQSEDHAGSDRETAPTFPTSFDIPE